MSVNAGKDIDEAGLLNDWPRTTFIWRGRERETGESCRYLIQSRTQTVRNSRNPRTNQFLIDLYCFNMFIRSLKCADFHKNIIFSQWLQKRPQNEAQKLASSAANQRPRRPERGPMRGGRTENGQPAIRLILRELSPHNVHTTNTQNYKQNVWSWGQQRYRRRGPFRRGVEKQEKECRGILSEIFTVFPSYMRSTLLIK